ncbi:condensation domain-containing protein, partial [Micromonospora phytophila]|uniref:condensation domain-containing protein n=1 Tax=Micromonospora phytophila TaxID=709888 RepID=UPI00202F0D26
PTENSIVSTAGPVAPDGIGRIDIGRPVDNRRLYILGPTGAPVPAGAVGEAYVGGVGVARGYLNRPAETAAAFLPDPFAGQPGARMYRTGDLVRLRGDGTVEFLGRRDDQVKIAGHRIEPGEAAATLTALPGVRQAAVIARHDRGDEPYLAAYVVASDDGEPPAARTARWTAALREHLPEHFVPRAWVLLDALPVAETGKIDLARLPAPLPESGDEPPRAGVEQLVHDAWCAELGVPRLALDVPFFTAGGHSLAAVRLANRLSEVLGVDVGVHQVLRGRGIRAMAAELDPAGRAVEVEDQAPATYQQELMWHRQRVAPNPAAVHMAVRITLTGPLDVPALGRAVDGLVARHDALRTRLVDREGHLGQEVLAHRPTRLPVVDLAAGEVEQWCVAAGRKPFPPEEGPWLRAELGRLADERWVLMLVVHHLCGDGWSMTQLLDELGRGYAAQLDGGSPPLRPPTRYVDYARGQRAAPVSQDTLRYWRDRLHGAPRTLALPTDRPRPATPSGRGAEYAFEIPPGVSDLLNRRATASGGSLFPMLAGAYAVLMSQLTGTPDVVLACPYAHRDDRRHESVVGLFTSPLLLRLSVDPGWASAGQGATVGGRAAADLVRQVDDVLVDAVRHQPAPLPMLYAALDPDWRTGMTPPVASMLFGWNPGIPTPDLPGLVAEAADQGLACARRDYATVLTPVGTGLLGIVEYSTDLFDEATVAAWSARYVAILAAIADHSGS